MQIERGGGGWQPVLKTFRVIQTRMIISTSLVSLYTTKLSMTVDLSECCFSIFVQYSCATKFPSNQYLPEWFCGNNKLHKKTSELIKELTTNICQIFRDHIIPTVQRIPHLKLSHDYPRDTVMNSLNAIKNIVV